MILAARSIGNLLFFKCQLCFLMFICGVLLLKGLAYADFADEKHIAAAIAKNRQKLLGKRISIRRSEPKGSSRGPSGKSFSMEQGKPQNYFVYPACVCLHST